MAGAWTTAEDEILTAASMNHGKKSNWKEISLLLPGRSNKSCRKRWIHSLDPALKRGRWTAAEDALLRSAIDVHGKMWWKVARYVPGRTDDQCAKRWKEKLNPSISRAPWSLEEDRMLVAAHETFGTQWNLVSAKLPGRPAVHCRNRFQSLRRSAASGKDMDDLTRQPTSQTLPESSTSRIVGSGDRRGLEAMVFNFDMLESSSSTSSYTLHGDQENTSRQHLNGSRDESAGIGRDQPFGDDLSVIVPQSTEAKNWGLPPRAMRTHLSGGVTEIVPRCSTHIPRKQTASRRSPYGESHNASGDLDTQMDLSYGQSDLSSLSQSSLRIPPDLVSLLHDTLGGGSDFDVAGISRNNQNAHFDFQPETAGPSRRNTINGMQESSAPGMALDGFASSLHNLSQFTPPDILPSARPQPGISGLHDSESSSFALPMSPRYRSADSVQAPPSTSWNPEIPLMMACPVPHCAFKASSVKELWMHITFLHMGDLESTDMRGSA